VSFVLARACLRAHIRVRPGAGVACDVCACRSVRFCNLRVPACSCHIVVLHVCSSVDGALRLAIVCMLAFRNHNMHCDLSSSRRARTCTHTRIYVHACSYTLTCSICTHAHRHTCLHAHIRTHACTAHMHRRTKEDCECNTRAIEHASCMCLLSLALAARVHRVVVCWSASWQASQRASKQASQQASPEQENMLPANKQAAKQESHAMCMFVFCYLVLRVSVCLFVFCSFVCWQCRHAVFSGG
jgi:hypothetical protein